MKKLIVILCLSQMALAQETPAPAHRYLGLGYKLGAFQTSELTNFMPVNRLIVSVDPIKYLRVDLQWGISNALDEEIVPTSSGAQQTFELEQKNSVMQFGAFGMGSFDNMLLFGGLRYGFSKSSAEYLQSNWNGTSFDYSTPEQTQDRKITSLVLGAEYRFGNRFAVGAELSYLIINETQNSGTPAAKDQKGKRNMTETCAFFRFFPI